MNNKKKNILVWIFTWAALLLVVLYSPIGSPDLYSSSDYYAGIPNANLSGSNITSPGFNGSNGDYNELNVPDYSSAENSSKSSAGYSYTAPASGNASSGAAASYSTSESQSYLNSKEGSSSGTAGGGGSTFISNNGSRGGNDASSAVSMSSGGITTLSANLTTSTPSQITKTPGQGYQTGQGGQNPGGDPDPGTSIPVGDGWVFLLLLAVGYGIIKKRFFATE